ncbi:MAG: helix-turn-helix transcriptional regulator [Paracoccus sp. (in: a-proteobacteria)]|nr:helix-turn-helix transcriptional regulator [Paracoccus sp. (in: a-proteobacteria)]
MTHEVDFHVGGKIRQRRWLIGMTQQQLAEQVGIKFQQIQKYETGANRVSASRLWDISKALNVPVAWFFEGIDHGEVTPDDGGLDADILAQREAMQLIRAYYAMPEAQRNQIFELARVLSSAA